MPRKTAPAAEPTSGIELTDDEKVLATGLRDLLNKLLGETGAPEASGDATGTDDGLGDLSGDTDLETGPTLDDVKKSLAALIKAKDKVTAQKVIKKAAGVDKLDQVEEDKYAAVIELADKIAAK